ncbi:protein LURP-one-related 10-like [Rosa rugosa]|uniref:protein LURP-one-related 10-like n=1 Tax=Rosa rugosa TaxID=74645 RepID=UPI002B40F707|nr:protein LURP-one-related 10-like [Rosa rugosa]
MKKSKMTNKWKAFRGDSKQLSDLIFTAKSSASQFHLDTKLKVFIAKNKTKNTPDFKLKGNWFERSCAVYAKNSSTIVAEMNKKRTVDSVLFKKDNFMVTVYPGMDYAFIVVPFVILDRTLLDAAGNPIITLRHKVKFIHEWNVYRGSSKEPSDLVFSAIKSSMFQFNTRNTTMNAPDFKVKGSWLQRSCLIYAGDSSTIIAEMHKKDTVQSVLFGKDNFMVRVCPGIDYASIATLIVILDAINGDR